MAYHYHQENHEHTYGHEARHDAWTTTHTHGELRGYQQQEESYLQGSWGQWAPQHSYGQDPHYSSRSHVPNGSYGGGHVGTGHGSSGNSSVEGTTANMAGFGARRFAQKQQQQADKEMARYEAEERRRMADEELRRHQWHEEEEERMYRQQQEDEVAERRRWKEHEAWERQQSQEQEAAHRQQQPAMQNHEGSGKNQHHGDPFWMQEHRHDQVDAQQPLHDHQQGPYQTLHPSSGSRMVNGSGHGAWQSEVKYDNDGPYDAYWGDHGEYDEGRGHRPSKSHASVASHHARQTVYEDGYEEPDLGRYGKAQAQVAMEAEAEMEAETEESFQDDGASTVRARSTVGAKSLERYTTYEPLPLAKCADCGESIAFEDLVEHECDVGLRKAIVDSPPESPPFVESPLETLHAAGNFPKVSATAATATPSPSTAIKSPFFNRYEDVIEKVRKDGRISPAFAQTKGSPIKTIETKNVVIEEEVQRRLAMKRRIEAQREAKRKESSSYPLPSPSLEVATKDLPRSGGPRTSPYLSSPNFALSASNSPPVRVSPLPFSSPSSQLSSLPRTHTVSDERLCTPVPSSAMSKAVMLQHKAQESSVSSSSTMSSAQSSLLGDSFGQASSGLTPSSSFDILSEREGVPSPQQKSSSTTMMTTRKPSEVPKVKEKRQSIDLGHLEDLLQDLEVSVGQSASKKASKDAPRKLPISDPRTRQQIEEERRRRKDKQQHYLAIDTKSATLQAQGHGPRTKRSSPSSASAKSSPLLAMSPAKVRPSHGSSAWSKSSRSSGNGKKKGTTILCSVCLCRLTTDMPKVERDGKLFCKDDFADLFLNKCRKCTKPIEERSVKSSDGAIRGSFHVSDVSDPSAAKR